MPVFMFVGSKFCGESCGLSPGWFLIDLLCVRIYFLYTTSSGCLTIDRKGRGTVINLAYHSVRCTPVQYLLEYIVLYS